MTSAPTPTPPVFSNQAREAIFARLVRPLLQLLTSDGR